MLSTLVAPLLFSTLCIARPGLPPPKGGILSPPKPILVPVPIPDDLINTTTADALVASVKAVLAQPPTCLINTTTAAQYKPTKPGAPVELPKLVAPEDLLNSTTKDSLHATAKAIHDEMKSGLINSTTADELIGCTTSFLARANSGLLNTTGDALNATATSLDTAKDALAKAEPALKAATDELANSTSTLIAKSGVTAFTGQITVIEKAIAQLKGTVDSIGSTLDLGKALQIQTESGTVGDTITQATTLVALGPTYSETDSATIANAVLKLQPQIQGLLDSITAHKDQFSKVGHPIPIDLTKTLQSTLKKEQSEANLFGLALEKKLSGTYASAAPGVNSQIQGYFTDALSKISS